MPPSWADASASIRKENHMFGLFKKKTEPKPDPAAEQAEKRRQEQLKIAELQSQIAELRRQSNVASSEIVRLSAERSDLMAQIRAASPALKQALAMRVANLDRRSADLTNRLALLEKKIGQNDAIINRLISTGAGYFGPGNVVDFDEFRDAYGKVIDNERKTDLDMTLINELDAELNDGTSQQRSDAAAILAEAEAAGQSPQASPEAQPFDSDDSRPAPYSR